MADSASSLSGSKRRHKPDTSFVSGMLLKESPYLLRSVRGIVLSVAGLAAPESRGCCSSWSG